MSKTVKASKATSRVYVVTGTTNPLKDGIARDITLVAVVESEPTTDVVRKTQTRTEGTKTYHTCVVETIDFTKTKVMIGLAVVSPVDKAFTEQYNELMRQSKLPTSSTGEAMIAQHAAADAAAMLKKNSSSLVTEQRGIEIAIGKAHKRKTAVASIVTDAPFFGKTMINVILNTKLKLICEDPDRFIRVTPVDAVTKELANRHNIALTEPVAGGANQPKPALKVHEVEEA
jgi:hypothetical protein